jgi:hypothetical protein
MWWAQIQERFGKEYEFEGCREWDGYAVSADWVEDGNESGNGRVSLSFMWIGKSESWKVGVLWSHLGEKKLNEEWGARFWVDEFSLSLGLSSVMFPKSYLRRQLPITGVRNWSTDPTEILDSVQNSDVVLFRMIKRLVFMKTCGPFSSFCWIATLHVTITSCFW